MQDEADEAAAASGLYTPSHPNSAFPGNGGKGNSNSSNSSSSGTNNPSYMQYVLKESAGGMGFDAERVRVRGMGRTVGRTESPFGKEGDGEEEEGGRRKKVSCSVF